METTTTIQASQESPLCPIVSPNPTWPDVIAGASLAVAAYYLSYLSFLVWYQQRMDPNQNLMMALENMLLYGQYVHELLLIPAAVLLIARRRWGVWLHFAYAIATLVVLALVAYKKLLSPFAIFFGPHTADALFDFSPQLVHLIYPVLVLAWLARPKIIRQVRSWVRGAGFAGSARQSQMPDAQPAWPRIVAAASITLGALSLAVLVATILWCCPSNSNFISAFSRLQWYWLNWFGRLNLGWFAGRVMPGVIGLSLIASGIALARRRSAAPAHLAVALLSLAFWVCFLTGYPWTGDRAWDFTLAPGGGAIVRYWSHSAGGEPDVLMLQGRPEVAIALLANPVFCLYPLFLLGWFARPRVWKQASAWRRFGRQGRRRGTAFGGLSAAAGACILGIVVGLPVAAAAWRAWPKAPPGIDLLGQYVSLPKSDAGFPLDTLDNGWNAMATIVCVGPDGSIFLDGRRKTSLTAMGDAVVELEKDRAASRMFGFGLFAADENTPWSVLLATLRQFDSSSGGNWEVVLLANDGKPREHHWLGGLDAPSVDDAMNWMDDLTGSAVNLVMLSQAATGAPAATGPAPTAANRRRVRIEIPPSGPVTVDGQTCMISKIARRLRRSMASSDRPAVEVLIIASDDTRFARVFAVIDQCFGLNGSNTLELEAFILGSSVDRSR